jgi:hypothetical protein
VHRDGNHALSVEAHGKKGSLNAPTVLAALALSVVAGSWVAAWSTVDLWHSGAGVGLSLLAGLLVLAAGWGRARYFVGAALALLVVTVDFFGVLALTLSRWEG